MEIKRKNTVLCDVYLKDSSYVIEEVMGEHTLTLNFLSRNALDIQINDYVEFEGSAYKVRHNEKVTKRETSHGWEYAVTFYSERYNLQDVEFFLHGKPERKKNFDAYTGTAHQLLELIVRNMNRVETGWSSGSCIESRTETFTFKDKKCGTVLEEVVKTFETEYWISNKTISIGKRHYDSNGLILGQGEGMGFKELEVSSVDDIPPVTVLYPYGADKNLGKDYGSDYLLLPNKKLFIEKNVDKYGRIEQSKQFEHIFPKGEFTVSSVINTTTFLASGIDFDITSCLIEGMDVIVTFQTGALAGYDLSIKEEGGWDYATKQIVVVENKQENALKVPGDINFSSGDKFILTGLKMPQSYIDKASEQLQEEASKWLEEHCEKRVQLRGKCDDVLFRQQRLFISCGRMVGVVSNELDIDREIRVTRVKRYIENDNKPTYRYEITLSDFLQGNGFKDVVDDIKKLPGEIESKIRPLREWTKRSWRDVMETFEMMFDPEGKYFSEKIKPLAVHTAQLIVGTNSQQLDLIDIRFSPNADNDPNYFKSTAGKLVHFTVSEDGIKEWSIGSSSHRLENSLPYYVYAKCNKYGSTGTIVVLSKQIKLEDVEDYFHFWVGVLNTPEGKVRSFNPNYGFTEIAGQTITTGIIKDKYANIVIDLVKGTFSGYGNITDKPDLSIYAYQSELKIAADKISATVTRVDLISNRIDTAGWITKAEGNTWWASSSLANGNSIISYINQSSTTVTINASRINLQGMVSFSMFSYSVQNTINDKLDGSDMGDLAWKDYISSGDLTYDLSQQISSSIDLSILNSTLNSYTKKGQISKSDLISALQSEMNGKLAGTATAGAGKLANVIINGQTLIMGGFIQADLINVKEIVCTKIAAVEGTVGGLSIYKDRLEGGENASILFGRQGSDYVSMSGKGVSGIYMETSKRDCVRVRATASGCTAVDAGGMYGGYAIKAYGNSMFEVGQSEQFRLKVHNGGVVYLEGIQDNATYQAFSGFLYVHNDGKRKLLMIK